MNKFYATRINEFSYPNANYFLTLEKNYVSILICLSDKSKYINLSHLDPYVNRFSWTINILIIGNLL